MMDTGDDQNSPQAKALATPEVEAAAMSLKLPTFWTANPQNWFRLAEIQFDVQAIKSDKQKYIQTLSSLSTETYDLIDDLLKSPPTQNHYATLKHLLLERLTPSLESKLESLLSGQDIGDRKPSEALRHIRTLAGDNFTEQIIRSLWIRKMPEVIKMALMAQPESMHTDSLVKIADKIHEVMTPGQHQLHAYEPRPSRPTHRAHYQSSNSDRVENPRSTGITVEERLARIEQRLNRISISERSRSRGRRFSSRSGSRSRSRSRVANSNYRQQGICWYHGTYGTNARRCNRPCKFNQTAAASTSNTNVDNQKN